MSACEIMEDLFFIERGYLNGNHFVFRSKAPILIDTAFISGFSETERLISDLGINLSDVRLIINTHSHCDHIGGNKIIQDRSGCDIALHKVGKYFIDTKDDWSTWWKYYDQDADFFKCTMALEDGEVLLIGPHEFEVIHTPGHAADQIVLYNRKEKILISSDTLWKDDMAVMTIRVEGSSALFFMQESLERLEALNIKIVYPGHGKPFTDIKGAISRSRRMIKDYMVNREKIGTDVLKKIIVTTLMMKKNVEEKSFFYYLMGTYWFKETVELYFNSEYEAKYNEVMNNFFERGVVKRKDYRLYTTVKH